MLRLENVSKTYRNHKDAVKNLSFEVQAGEIFGFIGPNGAGKTTTLKMITGMLAPTAGKILVGPHDIVESPVAAKQLMTFVPDHPELYDGIKGSDYLNFIGDVYGVSAEDRQRRIQDLAERFQLTGALGAAINTYSHGMR